MDAPGHDLASTGDLGEPPRKLPSDLPTSLDDRRTVRIMNEETEIYDAWQGQFEFAGSATREFASNMARRAVAVSYHPDARAAAQLQPLAG